MDVLFILKESSSKSNDTYIYIALLHVLYHLIFVATMQDKSALFFLNEGLEAHRGCLRSLRE